MQVSSLSLYTLSKKYLEISTMVQIWDGKISSTEEAGLG